MNYVIKDSALKKVLIRFGVDLTDKIHIVTNYEDLPSEFRYIYRTILNKYLNSFGPMFVIETPDEKFLYQKRDNTYGIEGKNARTYSERQILDILKVPPVGISLDDVINTFYEE